MRSLHADLTTAQQSASGTPYLTVTLRSRGRVTSRTYTTTDATNRVLSIQQAEGRWGSNIDSGETTYPISAIIRLQDSDKAMNVLDFKGYRAEIGWGFNTATGVRSSESPYVYVVEQQSYSFEGALFVELYCMSLWDMLRFVWEKQTTGVRIEYDKNVEVRHILMEMLGGRSPDAAVLRDDNIGWFSHTAAAANPTDGADLGTADDVDLLPAVPAVGDAFYFGDYEEYERISIDLTTPGAGTWTLTYEYWDGSAWSTLTVVDNTSAFRVGKLLTITFTKPTDWATINLSTTGAAGVGPSPAFPNLDCYYIRARVSAYSAVTTQPQATKIVLHHEFSVSMDTATAGQGDDNKPQYFSNFQQNVVDALKAILANTMLAVREEGDGDGDGGFHFFYTDDSVASPDYTYGTDHAFFSSTMHDAVLIPNKITYTNLQPGEAGTRYSGSSEDTVSSTAIGVMEQVAVAPDLVVNDAAGATHAANAIKRLKRDRSQGTVEAPMNVGQEIWDIVTIDDSSRSGQTYSGIVSSIVREYTPGVYRIILGMGGTQIHAMPLPNVGLHQFNPFEEAYGPSAGTVDNAKYYDPDAMSRVRDSIARDAEIAEHNFQRRVEINRRAEELTRTRPELDFSFGANPPYGVQSGAMDTINRSLRAPQAPRGFGEAEIPLANRQSYADAAVTRLINTLPSSRLGDFSPRRMGGGLGGVFMAGGFYSEVASPADAGSLPGPNTVSPAAESSGTSGRWIAGDGAVVIDKNGIVMTGSSSSTPFLVMQQSASAGGFAAYTDTGVAVILALTNSDLVLQLTTGTQIINLKGDTEIASGFDLKVVSGDLGVGITPLERLHLSGAGNIALQMTNTTVGESTGDGIIMTMETGGDFRFDLQEPNAEYVFEIFNVNQLKIRHGDVSPAVDGGMDLGTSTEAYELLFVNGYSEHANLADPAAPAAAHARFYAQLNGSSKMELRVRFPTGAVQVIATEP